MGENETFPVIISSKLNAHQEGKLLQTLKMHKNALGWTIADIKGISPLICTHKIYLEAKPSREMQRRLNPNIKEVVKNEVIKLLDNRIIYPISDSKWVSPTQVVPNEAKVRLSGESSNSFISHMPGTGKSTFAKKRRAKRLNICHRCARWTCNATCHSLGMVSVNREDKIEFIKDGLSKRSLDNLLLTLETHPNGDVHCAIHDLWP